MNPARSASSAPRLGHRRRSLVVISFAAAAAAVLGPIGPAYAHVQVVPDSTRVGTDATLTFRVPSESATASTVKIVVTLPQSPPLLAVTPQQVPGWSSTVTDAALPHPVVIGGTTLTIAPRLVTWIAQRGRGIPPEEYATFGLLVENLPDTASLAFPTVQYYSDGSAVAWNQPTVAGKPEPEHPVPVFALTGRPTATPAAKASGAVGTSADDASAHWLAAGALFLAAVACGIAITSVAATRRREAGART